MSGLQEALHQILAVEGVRAAALIDVATGMVVRSVGKAGTDLPAAAACVADEAKVVRAALGPGSQAGDLDEITVVTTSRLQLSRVLRTHPGDGLVLFVDLERDRSNIALAALRLRELAPAVLA